MSGLSIDQSLGKRLRFPAGDSAREMSVELANLAPIEPSFCGATRSATNVAAEIVGRRKCELEFMSVARDRDRKRQRRAQDVVAKAVIALAAAVVIGAVDVAFASLAFQGLMIKRRG